MVYYDGEIIYNDNGLLLLNSDCFDYMQRLADSGRKVDMILTSPPYNSNKKSGKTGTITNRAMKGYSYIRYDVHVDNMTFEQYCNYTRDLFNLFDRVLAKNGVILYNLSYGSENSNDMIGAINAVVSNTPFMFVDMIIWKKATAFPISSSPNKMTRIVEPIWVFCRRDEIITFMSNKPVTSVRPTGQKAYGNIYNYIEARNNDGDNCPYNKATYSSELCEKLIEMYIPQEKRDNVVIFDPFSGSGTTLVACYRKGIKGVGTELSPNQCQWAKDRIEKEISCKK